MTSITHRRHACLFRVLLGSYLLVHFLHLVGWSTELFSRDGMLSVAANPFHALPNPLLVFNSPASIHFVIASACVASLLLLVGRWDRVAAAWLWLVLACLFTRNPLIANPSLPYIGWLLLAHALVSFDSHVSRKQLWVAAWIVMAVGYSYSGLAKLDSPSWLDGSALRHLLENPLARPNALRHWLRNTPTWVLQALSYATLALEVLYAPLSLSHRARPWLWLSMVAMHLGILCLIDFADLTVGMLLLHAFTFDVAWLRFGKSHASPRATVLGLVAQKWRGLRGHRIRHVFNVAVERCRVMQVLPPEWSSRELPAPRQSVRSQPQALPRSTALQLRWRLLPLRVRGRWRRGAS